MISIRKPTKSSIYLLGLGLLSLVLLAALFGSAPNIAQAQAELEVNLITWTVIGLDSNDVTGGADQFPVGVEVCNTGVDAIDDTIQVALGFDSINSRLTIAGDTQKEIDTLDADGCVDVYFAVAVSAETDSIDTARDFTVSAATDQLTAEVTGTLNVVGLETDDNTVTVDIDGPTSVVSGEEATWVVEAQSDAHQQLAHFLTLCPENFDVKSVSTTYDNPADTTGSTLYADACVWDADTSACTDTNADPIGGNIVYSITAVATGAGICDVQSMVYHFTDDEYGYNGNFGDILLSVAVTSQDQPTATATVEATATPEGPTPTATSSVPTTTPVSNPTNTPTAVPGSESGDDSGDEQEPDTLPETGSRARPADAMSYAANSLLSERAASIPAVRTLFSVALVVTLLLGILLVAWNILMAANMFGGEEETSIAIRRVLSSVFVVSALALVGVLVFSLMTSSIAAEPVPVSEVRPTTDYSDLYYPPEIPATHLIIPAMNVDTELTEAPVVGSTWDVTQFFR